MCGRFALTATPDRAAAFLGLPELADFPPRYNIAPTQPVLMAIAGSNLPDSNLPDRQPMLVRWGLIPAWVKDTREFPLLFNARSEGAAEKASFRAAMRHRRLWCRLPASTNGVNQAARGDSPIGCGRSMAGLSPSPD